MKASQAWRLTIRMHDTWRGVISRQIMQAALNGKCDLTIPCPKTKLNRMLMWLASEGYETTYNSEWLMISWKDCY